MLQRVCASGRTLHAFDVFQNCSFLCLEQQCSGQGSTDFLSYIYKQSLNIRQDGIVSLNPCNGYCYRFQEFQAYHSLPKYIIQEDPLDGAVPIGRLMWPFIGETPSPAVVKHDDITTPTGVAGQLQCGALILLTLLGEVDCCYNLMTLHIPNHFLGFCRVHPLFSVPYP